MKTTIKKIFFGAVFSLSLFVAASDVHALAMFNNDPADCPTGAIYNMTTGQGAPTQACWLAQTVSAQSGNEIIVRAYFHNTGDTTATNTRVSVTAPQSGPTQTQSFTVTVSADGVAPVSRTVSVSLAQSQMITFDSAQIKRTQSSAQTPITAATQGGQLVVSVGSVAPGWPSQGSVGFKFRIGQTPQPPVAIYGCTDPLAVNFNPSATINDGSCVYQNNQSFSVITNTPQTITQTTAVLNGRYENASWITSKQVRFEWDTSTAFRFTTPFQTRTGVSGSFSDSITGLQPGVTYFYRAVVVENGVTRYGGVQSFTTLHNQSSPIIFGCTNPAAYNYNPSATIDNGSCLFHTTPQPVTASVVTTPASGITQTSAVLNGLVYNTTGTLTLRNTTNTISSTWFEWGITVNYGSRTTTQTTSLQQAAFADTITGLQPGTIYYYRAVVQNQNGAISYGDRFWFRTLSSTTPVVTEPTTVIREVVTVNSGTGSNGTISLSITDNNETFCPLDTHSYTVTYKNITRREIGATVLQITLPNEVSFRDASRGTFNRETNVLTVDIGTLRSNEEGTVTFRVRGERSLRTEGISVVTARLVYTNPINGAQEDAVAYDINYPNQCTDTTLGAAALFGGSFLPQTLIGWLVLLLILLALIILARTYFFKKA